MNNEKELREVAAHSQAGIAKATAVALVVALLILFTTVLPAEFGIDPLKTGAALGLTALSKGAEAKAEPAPAPSAPAPTPPPAATAGPEQKGAFTSESKIYKVDAEDLLLRPGEGVEIKYHLQKGSSMVFAWKANGNLRFEFHGEPDQKPNKDYYDSYELDNKAGKDHAYGTFTAPSTGIHGWFWENKGDKDVQIRLTTAGFYDSAKMYAGGPPEDMPVEDVK